MKIKQRRLTQLCDEWQCNVRNDLTALVKFKGPKIIFHPPPSPNIPVLPEVVLPHAAALALLLADSLSSNSCHSETNRQPPPKLGAVLRPPSLSILFEASRRGEGRNCDCIGLGFDGRVARISWLDWSAGWPRTVIILLSPSRS